VKSWRVVLHNTLLHAGLNGFAKVLKLVALLTLATSLGPGGFAIVAFGWGFVEVFRVVAIGGADVWTTRAIARGQPDAAVRARGVASIRRTTLLSIAACLLAAVALGYERTWLEAVGIAAVVLPAAALGPVNAAVFEARLQVGRLAGYYISPALLQLATAVAALSGTIRSPLLLLGLLVVSEYVGAGLAYLAARRHVAAAPQHQAAPVPLRETGPIAGQRLLWALLLRSDLIFLGLVAAAPLVGAYSATSKLAESLYLAGTALTTSLFPLMASPVQQSPRPPHSGSLGWAMLVFLSLALPGIVLTTWLMPALLRYPADLPLSATLFLSVVWSVANALLTARHFAESDSTRPPIAYACGLVCFWISVGFLWKVAGGLGVALARLLQELLVFGLLTGWRAARRTGIGLAATLVALSVTVLVLVGARMLDGAGRTVLLLAIATACAAAAAWRWRDGWRPGEANPLPPAL
jgi:O-antigen/teichoic acid export membrane protein